MQAEWELDNPEGLKSPPRGGEECALFVFTVFIMCQAVDAGGCGGREWN